MNKVVVITGATKGLGKALANLYLQKKYSLILTGRIEKEMEEFKNKENVDIVVGDLTKQETLNTINKIIADKYKRVDILINNAGITFIQPFEENTEEQLDKLLSIDLKAPILLTQKLYPFMKSQKSGTIININSSAGKEAKLYHTMYNAAKFGLYGFTSSLRLEAKKHNIRVLSIHPGGIKTDLYSKLNSPPDISSFMEAEKVAEIIVNLSETEDLSPDEIVINRMSK